MSKGKTKDVFYLTQTQQMKHLTKKQYETLRLLCHLAKNLYNVGLYNVRQYYFAEKEYLRYESNYHLAKTNENYKWLNSNMAQQILKEVDGSFKSFFGLIQLAKKGSYDFHQIKLPQYLKKDGQYALIIGQIRIKESGEWDIPMSPSFRKHHGKITLQMPSNLKGKTIKEIRILPKSNARFFEVHYTYEAEALHMKNDPNHVLAIDLGVDNLATCVTNQGKSFIIDGKRLKSLNQWFNKENARLQSIKDKQGIKKATKKQGCLQQKRHRQVRDYINKTVRIIMKYCHQQGIGTLVIGYNPTLQKETNLGTQNQNLVSIPLGDMKEKLEYLCKHSGIAFHKQEESYTSKADFFANDDMPVYKAHDPNVYTFSGKRVSRGQYRSVNGKVYNADCIGALNILRKSSLGGAELLHLQGRGNLDMPLRIRVS